MSVRARILIVEDDVLQADLTTRVVESQGFYVEVASDGIDAIRRMRAGWFDVVLTDYLIPGLDGLAVGRLIADLRRAHGRPRLIAVSATPDRLREREQDHSVFDAVIGKPWHPQALINGIEQCLASAPPAAYRTEPGTAPSPAAPTLTGQTPARAAPACAARVLIVDDDAPLRSVLALGLRSTGYQVDEAADGLDALRKVASERYDVVVVDYHMPEIDGLATSRLIVDLIGSNDRPRLVALTATPGRLSAQEEGSLSVFDEVIPKDRGMNMLLAAVKRCAEYKSLRDVAPPDVVRLDSMLKIGLENQVALL